jgi:hypothetical protein
VTADSEDLRTMAVLERFVADDVHRAVRALPKRRQQDLAKALRGPVTALTDAGSAASFVRSRARKMSRAGVSVLGRELVEMCGDETVNALGDSSDDPSYDELLAVLEPITDKWGPRLVAVLLAATADGDFPARAVCERILDEDPRFALDALGIVQVDEARPVVARAPKETPEERAAKQEQRRQRKQQPGKAKPPAPARPRYRKEHAAPTPMDAGEHEEGDASGASVGERAIGSSATPLRRVNVVGAFKDVRYDDPLIGATVVAFIPFEDPEDGHLTGKHRPSVVIAASGADQLIVRPCYSEGGLHSRTWRSVEIKDPRAAGLDKGGYVSSEEFGVDRADIGEQIGWLAREDWNTL